MKIGLNAHLMAGGEDYRSAGIHGYISQLLRHLPACAPGGWRFEAMVGADCQAEIDGVELSRSRMDTRAPWRRIVWEQALQPGRLRHFDLYHAMAFVAPLMLACPMVVTVYDLSFVRFPERLSQARRKYLRAFTALSCRRARRVLAISRSTAQDLSDYLDVPAEKIDVTPLGYDKRAMRPLPSADIERFRARKGLPARFWLFIGTLEPRKNLPMLLRAYSRLPRSERLPLIMGGGAGWKADEVFATIEAENLTGEVRHIGYLPAAELPLWYNSAEALLYPSLYEGFGLPLLEAMACGTPVLTSDVSSMPEVVGEAGLCLSPRDGEAWTGSLNRIARDESWREMARDRSLKRAEGFSWARTAELTIASYRKAAKTIASPSLPGKAGRAAMRDSQP